LHEKRDVHLVKLDAFLLLEVVISRRSLVAEILK